MSDSKLKQCSRCPNKYPSMWKAKTKDHGAMCKSCWYNYCKENNKGSKKLKTTVRKISNTEIERQKKYRPIRDKYLKENPICVYPGCNSKEVSVHHAKGRTGDLLFDTKYFRSLCWKHHQKIEHYDVGLGRELNLIIKRLEK